MNDKICIYLRKSRADEEVEKTLGEGETLRKHRKTLMKFAQENKLNVIEIKEEIVSGDSLFFRPKMLELLREVEEKKYHGVLVMDIDRLSRGAMKDQGTILEVFKESKTLIITPGKTYDLTNEYDEEMTEFKTFFARRELKTITKRMQNGRIRSVEEGNYIAAQPPLGYDITYINRCRTLKINESESEVIKLIFKLYIDGDGAGTIADNLNNLGYKTKSGNKFTRSSILAVIKNYVYIGKVTWRKYDIKKSKIPGQTKCSRLRDKSDWIISDGKHQSIIDLETWDSAQEILKCRYHPPYSKGSSYIVNPLAGIVFCSNCGARMVRKVSRGVARIVCPNNCGMCGTRLDILEENILKNLNSILKDYESLVKSDVKKSNFKVYEIQLNGLKKNYETLKTQRSKLFDLLEQGIYDNNTFLERSKIINEKISDVQNEIKSTNGILKKKNNKIDKDTVVKIKSIIDGYSKTDDIKLKNELLKSIIEKVVYFKEGKKHTKAFEIKVFTKI